MRKSTVAPRLSELETNKYFIPRSRKRSSKPLLIIEGYRSPCPGGHHSRSGFSGHEIGSKLLASSLGTLLCRKSSVPSSLSSGYLRRYSKVSRRVLKLFIK